MPACCAWPRTSRCRRGASASARRARARGVRDADAGAHVERLALEVDRRLERVDDARAPFAPSRHPRAAQQHGELVAAQPRDALRALHDACRRRRPRAAPGRRRVAERVVDVLEAVEVHQEDGEPDSPRGLRDGLLERIGEARAVGEIRERILVGELEDALLAVRDAAAHVIEARGEHADLVGRSTFTGRRSRPARCAWPPPPASRAGR